MSNCPVRILKATKSGHCPGLCPLAQQLQPTHSLPTDFSQCGLNLTIPYMYEGHAFTQSAHPFLQGGASVQQGLSAAFEFSRLGWHRGAADKRYSLGLAE